MNALSAPQVGRKIADALETANIPYALGGALALGVWGFPRATVDVDVDVFVGEDRWTSVIDVLARTGCTIDRASALASARERGDLRAFHGPMRVDVFVPSIPFYDSAPRRRRQVALRHEVPCAGTSKAGRLPVRRALALNVGVAVGAVGRHRRVDRRGLGG